MPTRRRGIGYMPVPGVGRDYNGPYIPLAQATGKACITLPDVLRSVEHLAPEVAGDSNKYKKPVIMALVDDLNNHIVRGGPKRFEYVRDKLADWFAIYRAITFLVGLSGLHYDNINGAGIETPEEHAVWTAAVLKNQDCMPFRNKGWEVFDDLARLHPQRVRGTFSFSPATGVVGNQPAAPTHPAPSAGADLPGQAASFLSAAEESFDGAEDGVADSDVGDAAAMPPTTSPPNTPERLSQKRPAEDALPASTVSKRARPSAAVDAAREVRAALGEFGQSLDRQTDRLVDVLRPGIDPSPVRRKKALEVLHEKEGWLSDFDFVRASTILETTAKADTYVMFSGGPSPRRRAWIDYQLGL